MFMIGEGIELPDPPFSQDRFLGSAQNKNERVTFFPTYSTTGFIFRNMKGSGLATTLIYGRWGIGKSLSIVLFQLLMNEVSTYKFESYSTDTKSEYKRLEKLLPFNQKILYWTINQLTDATNFQSNINSQLHPSLTSSVQQLLQDQEQIYRQYLWLFVKYG